MVSGDGSWDGEVVGLKIYFGGRTRELANGLAVGRKGK